MLVGDSWIDKKWSCVKVVQDGADQIGGGHGVGKVGTMMITTVSTTVSIIGGVVVNGGACMESMGMAPLWNLPFRVVKKVKETKRGRLG